MNLKKQLGSSIKYYRIKNNLTQEQLSEKIGISCKSLSKIENGNNFPSAETLHLISEALKTKYYELFLFGNKLDYEKMKEEILKSLSSEKYILALYECLKNVK